jgi:hypothetical protein
MPRYAKAERVDSKSAGCGFVTHSGYVNTYKVVDASPGAGGMLRGFLDSGRFSMSGYYAEVGSPEEETLAANLPSFSGKMKCDVLVGSFYNPNLTSSQYYRNIMRELRPAISLVEIPASLNTWYDPPGACFGYAHEWYVLDAVDYLVPQHRKRCWVVSIDRELVGPNFKIGSPVPRNHPPTVRDAIGDLPLSPMREGNGSSYPYPYREGFDIHTAAITSRVSRDRYDTIPPGSSADAIPVELRPKYSKDNIGPSDIYGRLRWDYPAKEITPVMDPGNGRFIHPEWVDFNHPDNQNRLLSPLEISRLQTFPDTYKWYGTRKSIMRQIGEATPPAQAMCWAHFLADLLDNE